ncbi:MAG TPA: apolipoprotein N-acyltransferase [Nocardioides sp.]
MVVTFPRRAGLAALAGAAATCMFDPVGLVLAGPLAILGFTLALRGVGLRAAAVLGLVFGGVFSFSLLWWMRAVGTDAWIALSVIETAYFLLVGPLVTLVQRLRGWPVWVAATWVSYEELRAGWPFGGFPWGRLAFGVMDTAFAPLLPYLGTAGVGFVVALLGTATAWVVVRVAGMRRDGAVASLRRPRVLVGLAAPYAAIGAVVLLAAVRPYQAPTDGEVVQVAAVQGDVPGDGDDVVPVHREVTRNHVDTTVELGADVAAGDTSEPRFVVWPENSTAVDPFLDGRTRTQIDAAVSAVGVPVVVGGMVDAVDDEQVLNQGIVWDPVTGPGDRYAKRHPVPFGEYIPFRNAWFTSVVEDFDLIPRDMLSGARTTPLDVAGVQVGNAICFDVAYDDGFREQVSAGAEMLTVQTSNAMFIRTHQIDQQFEMTRMRALESGKYLVVAAINGVSGIIRPDGSVAATIDTRTRGVVAGEVVLNDAVTPAMRYGAGIALLLAVTTLLAAAGGLAGGAIGGLVGAARTRRSMARPGRADERSTADDAAGEGPATTTRERVG